jgi:hypothetical protein
VCFRFWFLTLLFPWISIRLYEKATARSRLKGVCEMWDTPGCWCETVSILPRTFLPEHSTTALAAYGSLKAQEPLSWALATLLRRPWPQVPSQEMTTKGREGRTRKENQRNVCELIWGLIWAQNTREIFRGSGIAMGGKDSKLVLPLNDPFCLVDVDENMLAHK